MTLRLGRTLMPQMARDSKCTYHFNIPQTIM